MSHPFNAETAAEKTSSTSPNVEPTTKPTSRPMEPVTLYGVFEDGTLRKVCTSLASVTGWCRYDEDDHEIEVRECTLTIAEVIQLLISEESRQVDIEAEIEKADQRWEEFTASYDEEFHEPEGEFLLIGYGNTIINRLSTLDDAIENRAVWEGDSGLPIASEIAQVIVKCTDPVTSPTNDLAADDE